MSKRTIAALLGGIGLGVLVAGVAILVWWSVFERDRPMQVVGEAQRLEAVLDKAPYITLYRGERPVTIIAPRSAYGLDQWLMEDAAELAEMGREVRLIMVPSGHGGVGEDATIAEIWLNRDIDLLRQWFSMRAEHWTGVGLERANTSSARMEALAEAEGFKRSLMRSLSRNGEDTRWPVVVWRDRAGQMAVCLCNTANAASEARRTLGLPQRDAPYMGDMSGSEPFDPPVVREDEYEDERHSHDDRHGYEGYEREDDERERSEDMYPRLTAPPEKDRRDELWRDSPEPEPVAPSRTPSPRLPGDAIQERPSQPRPAQPNARTPAPAPQPAQPARPRRELNTEPPKANKDAESLFY